jgi:hypothetical protein
VKLMTHPSGADVDVLNDAPQLGHSSARSGVHSSEGFV